jgi:hypothetical protein
MTSRRGFLSALLGGASALAVDPERLIWMPGQKKIFIPPPPQYRHFQVVLTETMTMEEFSALYLQPAAEHFERIFAEQLLAWQTGPLSYPKEVVFDPRRLPA